MNKKLILFMLFTNFCNILSISKPTFIESKNSCKKAPNYSISESNAAESKTATDAPPVVFFNEQNLGQIILTVCYGQDSLSRLILAQITKYCAIKKSLNPMLDITCKPIFVDNNTNSTDQQPRQVSCYINGTLIFSEVINAASIARPAKAAEKFDDILGFNITRNITLTKEAVEIPHRSFVKEAAVKNCLRRNN